MKEGISAATIFDRIMALCYFIHYILKIAITSIESFEGTSEVFIETESMTEAVKIAYKLAEPKDTVLLSPACASFDLFKNYEDRGDQFKAAVRNL